MWWFGRSSGKPEAGQKILYQHDGMKPHVAKQNEQHWSRHGKMKGFHIEVTGQQAQSPDLNTNYVTFFASLQKDTELVAKENVKGLVAADKLCLDECPAERMDAVWHCLFPSYNAIITPMGDNNYSHHTGSRAAHSRSKRAGDAHERSMPLNDVHKAEEQLKLYARKLDGLDEVRTSSSNSTDEEDN